MEKIAITGFAAGRHFDPEFHGTKILSCKAETFEQEVSIRGEGLVLVDGYAPFCKHLFLRNWTDALCGVALITSDNEHLLKSGYEARRPEELPVLLRWFEGLEPAKAEWLDVILYTADQLREEGIDIGDAGWGIVSINGGLMDREDPMNPTTMLRNALGISEGGSGVELDRDEYTRSVEFWSKHASVR